MVLHHQERCKVISGNCQSVIHNDTLDELACPTSTKRDKKGEFRPKVPTHSPPSDSLTFFEFDPRVLACKRKGADGVHVR